MPTPRRRLLPLMLALSASVAAHMLLLVPFLLMAMQAHEGDATSRLAQSDPGHVLPSPLPPVTEPEDLKLGIEKGVPSTMNWIGYDTYKKHLAMVSETEQPALGTEIEGPMADGAPGDGAPAMPAQPPSPPPATMLAAAPTPATDAAMAPDLAPAGAVPPPPAEMPAQKLPGPPALPAAEPEPAPRFAGEGSLNLPPIISAAGLLGRLNGAEPVAVKPEHPLEGPDPKTTLPHPPEDPTATPPQSPPAAQQPAPTATDSQPQPAQPATPSPSPAASSADSAVKPATPTPPAAEAPAPAPAAPAATAPAPPAPPPSPPSSPSVPAQSPAKGQGAPDDKASDPTSVIDVPRDSWQLGRPLAAKGLELKPKRPTFTTLTLMTSSPCNPVCLIKFRNDGIPAQAVILRSACDSRIDKAIEDSLYGWRASGERLKQIDEKDTVDVIIRIILVRPPD